MSDDGRKLHELYGMLGNMEESLPAEDSKSKALIENLKALNADAVPDETLETSKTTMNQYAESAEGGKKIPEMPESIEGTLNRLRKTLELVSPQVDGDSARQYALVRRSIDEFQALLNALQTEKDMGKKVQMAAGIKEVYQNISAFLGKKP